jgi:hypothetical protein
MFAVRRSLSALVFAGAFVASAPAFATDEPIATANRSPPPAAQSVAPAPGVVAQPAAADRGVAAQIDDYLKTSPAIVLPKDGAAAGITSGGEEPRQVHGVVDVAVGTHGYRSAYVRSDFPVGKTGTLSIAVQDTQFKGRFGGYGYGGYGDQTYRNQNVALGLAFGGAAQNGDPRCRDSGMSRHRIDPMLMGPMGSAPGGDRAYACDRPEPAPLRPLD